MLTLEERITRLEHLEAIRQVTFRYAWYVNQGWNNYQIEPDKLDEIFTPDAVYQFPAAGLTAMSLSAIQRSLVEETKAVQFALHGFANPVIGLNGDLAEGKWLFSVVSQFEDLTLNQVYMSQEIDYRLLSIGWRISRIDLQIGRVIKNAPPAGE